MNTYLLSVRLEGSFERRRPQWCCSWHSKLQWAQARYILFVYSIDILNYNWVQDCFHSVNIQMSMRWSMIKQSWSQAGRPCCLHLLHCTALQRMGRPKVNYFSSFVLLAWLRPSPPSSTQAARYCIYRLKCCWRNLCLTHARSTEVSAAVYMLDLLGLTRTF